jgi:hypothetical protein
VTVHIVPTGRHGHHGTIREQPRDLRDFIEPRATGERQIMRWQNHADPAGQATSTPKRPQQPISSVIHHRSSDRSEHSRRSTMTERPQNFRTAPATDRTQNNRWHASESRRDEGQAPSRSYHGSHRAQSIHRGDDNQTPANDRSSRMGHYHSGHREEHSNRR